MSKDKEKQKSMTMKEYMKTLKKEELVNIKRWVNEILVERRKAKSEK